MKKLSVFVCTLMLLIGITSTAMATGIYYAEIKAALYVDPIGPLQITLGDEISDTVVTTEGNSNASAADPYAGWDPSLLPGGVFAGATATGDATGAGSTAFSLAYTFASFTVSNMTVDAVSFDLTLLYTWTIAGVVSELGESAFSKVDLDVLWDGANFPFVDEEATAPPDFYFQSNPDDVSTSYVAETYALNLAAGEDFTFRLGVAAHGNAVGVPEPTTLLLLGTGLIGLAGLSRRKFFKK